MDNFQKDIIKIIESALDGESKQLSSEFVLEDAIKIARKHGLAVLFYYGCRNCGFSEELCVQELFTLVCKNMAFSEQQKFETEKILKAFDDAKIDYMPLKGILLKKMYPNASMRTMGDADILIKTDQYPEITDIMKNSGFSEYAESTHELTWKKNNIMVELHKCLIPTYNKDYYSYFGDGWKLAKICDGTRFSMTDEDQLVFLFTHFAKHYRDKGIGIRHILDLWVYRQKTPDLDEEYIKTQLEELKLYEFYRNVNETLEVWFCGKKENLKTDLITQYIFDSGVYGTRQNEILSLALKSSKENNNTKQIKVKKFFRSIFVPYKEVKRYYPFLGKLPVLYPVMLIYHLFRRIFKKNKLNKYFSEMKSLSENNINEFQKSLNFVGLDFNFKE